MHFSHMPLNARFSQSLLWHIERTRPSLRRALLGRRPRATRVRRACLADEGRCSAGKRSDTHAAATSLGAMRPVEALYQMRARARTTFRSSPFQSDSAFHWAIVSKSALEKCSFGTGSKNVAADRPRSAKAVLPRLGQQNRKIVIQNGRLERSGKDVVAEPLTELKLTPRRIAPKALLRFERQQLAPAVAMFRHRPAVMRLSANRALAPAGANR